MTDTNTTVRSTTGYCTAWGADKNARRVHGLTRAERDAIRAGAEVRITDCPAYRGATERRVICVSGRFYARIPA